MKIKFNWGTGIFIFLVIFFIAIFSFIIFAFRQNNDLVVDDYYPKEITYQQQIDKVSNLEKLGQEIILEKQDGLIILNFPDTLTQAIIGGIMIYRPSDASEDINLKIETDSQNRQAISTKEFISGKYTIKVDWVHEGTGYYQELYYFK